MLVLFENQVRTPPTLLRAFRARAGEMSGLIWILAICTTILCGLSSEGDAGIDNMAVFYVLADILTILYLLYLARKSRDSYLLSFSVDDDDYFELRFLRNGQEKAIRHKNKGMSTHLPGTPIRHRPALIKKRYLWTRIKLTFPSGKNLIFYRGESFSESDATWIALYLNGQPLACSLLPPIEFTPELSPVFEKPEFS